MSLIHGHADFIAEVERSFRVLDGAILVISAVEGVQAQTKILMRTLQKLNIPTILFVNKIDRTGANTEKVVKQIKTILSNETFPSILSKMKEQRKLVLLNINHMTIV